MAVSQNGYPANNRDLVSSRLIPGTQVKVTVRNGPAGDLLLYAAGRWDREVEDIDNARGALDDWGYAERPIRGGTTLSNHASGTAVDLNATKHPLGTAPAANFTADQRARIRRILTDCRGAIRWGGDYTGRKDGMHLEIVVDEVRCAQVLARLDLPTTSVRPTIARDATGLHVQFLQRFLGVAKAGDPGYGTFGPLTEQAVIRYQKMRGLEADGVVGPATWMAIGL